MKIKKPEMMKQAEKMDKDISGFGMQILCFLGVFLVITILQSIPTAIMMFQEMANLPEVNDQVMSDIMTKYQNVSGNMLIIMLFSTIATVIIPILYCKFIEKRSLASMGIVKKHIIRRYLLGIIIGFLMLIKGADIFVDGASSVAGNFKVSKMLIGLTIVAFGTSSPEFAVSVKSLLSGSGDIVLGNVIGSNILNILLTYRRSTLYYRTTF